MLVDGGRDSERCLNFLIGLVESGGYQGIRLLKQLRKVMVNIETLLEERGS